MTGLDDTGTIQEDDAFCGYFEIKHKTEASLHKNPFLIMEMEVMVMDAVMFFGNSMPQPKLK